MIPFLDKLLRALFVALAVGFAWGIRGHFGHLIGAMFPGAMLGLAFAYVSGQKNVIRWAPLLGTLGGLGIAIGGYTSYAVLHGYAQSGPPAPWYNFAYGFAMLILQGGCWGIFGCAAIGAILDAKKPSVTKFLELVACIFLAGWLFQFILVQLIGFHVNPPRSNALFGHIGGAVALLIWLAWNKYQLALRGALLGFTGFGTGMMIGRELANLCRHLEVPWRTDHWVTQMFHFQSVSINHWNIMEITVGLVGGLIFTLGMLGKKIDECPKDNGYSGLNFMGILYVLGMIPLLHLFVRTNWQETLKHMTNILAQWKAAYPDITEHLSAETLNAHAGTMANLMIVLGWICAAVWLYLYYTNRERWNWFPVLALGAVISILDLFLRHYFYNPMLPGIYVDEAKAVLMVDMRTVSMGIYGLMILYVIIREGLWTHKPLMTAEEKMQKAPWLMCSITCIVIYGCVIGAAFKTNGDVTMKNANTRWPLWEWKLGPFTGEERDVSGNVSP